MLVTGEMNAIPTGATKGCRLVDFHQVSMRGSL